VQERLTIIVSGMIAGDPWQGGASWSVLQYVLGLMRMGHDVYFIEPIRPGALFPPDVPLAQSENAAYCEKVMREFHLEGRTALLAGSESFGLSLDEVKNVTSRTDVLFNISGLLTDEELLDPIPIRIYLDLDPCFNQLWHEVQGIDRHFSRHNRFVTVGNSLGEPGCSVPTCGIDWIKTFQPVVLGLWPAKGTPIVYDGLTTVANWRAYGSVEHNGVFYGQKAHSLREFVQLPTMSTEKFLLALGIHKDEKKDLEALAQNRWHLLDPAEAAGTPQAYQRFIQSSKAEFGIAKSGYVLSGCGWFSDRSACYLASGRPVVAQETGFSSYLPTGGGLFPFQTSEHVLDAIEQINRDYLFHSRSAASIACEYFESSKVLHRILERAGLC